MVGWVRFEPATSGDITRTLPQTPPFFIKIDRNSNLQKETIARAGIYTNPIFYYVINLNSPINGDACLALET